MPRKGKTRLLCALCKKVEVHAQDPEFPFCSERCRLIDLGNWASGRYVVSSPLPDADHGSEPESPSGDN
jgi:endogenous inhibitor of DNA gyrase (YacG/DUF329 family)